MADVLQVITALEGFQITKEQLESTRLGRHINILRRMTKNESLARRAKNLLKKWREMVLPAPSAATSTTAPSASSNPINTMPTAPATPPVNGYTGREHRSHHHNHHHHHNSPSTRSGSNSNVLQPIHGSSSGADQPNHHSNGNRKSANNSNRRYGGNASSVAGGNSSMPINNYSFNNSVNSVADSTTDDVQRKPVANSKQRKKDVSDVSTTQPPATYSDPYRFLSESGELKSRISISALPKIPKKTSSSSSTAVATATAADAASSSTSNVNRMNVDRSRSPLVLNSNSSSNSSAIKSNQPSPSVKWSAAAHQHQQHFAGISELSVPSSKFPPTSPSRSSHGYGGTSTHHQQPHHSVKSTINGRDQNFYSLNSGEKKSQFPLVDSNLEPSSTNEHRSSQSITTETKKKHKKNKKEKKEKKKKHSSSTVTDKSVEQQQMQHQHPAIMSPPLIPPMRVTMSAPIILDLADSLSNSSMSLFNSTTGSMKHLPKSNVSGDNGGGSRSMSRCSSTIPPADLTFSGKFSKAEDTVINIDSSSCSNSPKYAKLPSERSHSPCPLALPSRSSSPVQMKKLLANRTINVTDDDNIGQSMTAVSVPPLPSSSFNSLSGDNNFLSQVM